MKKICAITLLFSLLLLNVSFVSADQNTPADTQTLGNQGVFADFPAEIDKLIEDESHMTLTFTYQKALSANDSANLTLTDTSTNSVDFEFAFSQEQNMAVFEHISIDKQFNASINETISGTTSSYSGLLTTKKVQADFPEIDMQKNRSIKSDSASGKGKVSLNKILYKDTKKSESAKAEESNKVTEEAAATEATTDNQVLTATAESNPFTLSDNSENKTYEVQTTTKEDGVTKHYRGYYSTQDQSIMEPGFTFDVQNDSLNESLAVSDIQAMTMTSIYGDTLPKGTFDGKPDMYIEELPYHLTSSDAMLCMFTVPTNYNGNYTFETIGNLDTKISMYLKNSDETFTKQGNTILGGGTGGNAKYSASLSNGVVKYFVIELQSGTDGYMAFKVSNDDWTEENNYFSDAAPFEMNAYHEDSLDYGADVDAFSFTPIATETNYFQMNYNTTALKICPYYYTDDIYNCWKETELIYNSSGQYPDPATIPVTKTMSVIADKNYVFVVKNQDHNSDSGQYRLMIKNSYLPDQYEPNDNYYDGYDLTSSGDEFATITFSDPTFHRDDCDYYKFTLLQPKTVTISATPPSGATCNMRLLSEDSQGDIDEKGSVVNSSSPTLALNLDSGTYYTEIYRANASTNYFTPYSIAWNVADTPGVLPAPTNLSANITSSTMPINWTAVPGATQYDICINNDIYTSTTNAYTFSSIALSRLYQIKVRAKNVSNLGYWNTINLYYGKYGDVNRDGIIDQVDNDVVTRYCQTGTGLDADQFVLADVNGDAYVNALDEMLITLYKLGKITSFPIGVSTVLVNSNRSAKLIRYGDVNEDGVINQTDRDAITLYIQIGTGLVGEQRILADVDGNGFINGSDEMRVHTYILGKITTFPVGTYAAFYTN